jgi:hypothetical protein
VLDRDRGAVAQREFHAPRGTCPETGYLLRTGVAEQLLGRVVGDHQQARRVEDRYRIGAAIEDDAQALTLALDALLHGSERRSKLPGTDHQKDDAWNQQDGRGDVQHPRSDHDTKQRQQKREEEEIERHDSDAPPSCHRRHLNRRQQPRLSGE